MASNKKRRIIASPLAVSAADIFPYFAAQQGTAILDSSLVNGLGRYTIIAAVPYHTIEADGNVVRVNGMIDQHAAFADTVNAYLNTHHDDNDTAFPIVSGAVGYFSYDYGRERLGIPSRHAKDINMADARLVFYDLFVIENNVTHEVHFIANGETEDADQLLQRVVRKLQQYLKLPLQPDRLSLLEGFHMTRQYTPHEYEATVQQLIDYIVAGDVYIANLTQRLTVTSPVQPFSLFTRLHNDNPAPFSAYLNYRDCQFICASMERFLQIHNGLLETRPIKGTRPRGTTPALDAALRQELADSEKDKSELLMIVDLERNDMNKVCDPGSVVVPELFAIEDYATVFHLVATVQGKLKDGVTVMDALQAMFPGGSITGAPKYRAMEIIDELERCRRGLYTGSIGYMTLDGDCDFNIVIRTAVHQNGTYQIGVGGGITSESDPIAEYNETMQKAKALLYALH